MSEDISKSKDKFVLRLEIALFVVVCIVLWIIKANSPDFSVATILYIILGVAIFLAGAFVVTHYINKSAGSPEAIAAGKLAPAITVEQARIIAKRMLTNDTYGDYVLDILSEQTEDFGKGTKSSIYTMKAKGCYETGIYTIILNMHKPYQKFTIFTEKMSDVELELAKNRLADYPDDLPEVRKVTMQSPITGVTQTVEEITSKKEDKEKEAKEKDI